MRQKRQQVEQVKDLRPGLLPVPVVMLQLITVILVHIELFVLDLPARAAQADEHRDLLSRDLQIGHPTVRIALVALLVSLPDLNQIDQHFAGLRPRPLTRDPVLELTPLAGRPCFPLPPLARAQPIQCFDPLEQFRMRSGLGHQHEAHPQLSQLLHKRFVRLQIIAGRAQLQWRMVLPQSLDEPLAGAEFAILLLLPVLIAPFLSLQRQDSVAAGLDQRRRHH